VVTVNVLPDGIVELTVATMPMGQGIAPASRSWPSTCSACRSRDPRRAWRHRPRQRLGSAGSRSLFTGGAAVQVASERTIEQAKNLAGEALEASSRDIEYRAGRFTIAGTDRGIGLFELAAKQPTARITARWRRHRRRAELAERLPHLRSRGRPDTGAVEVAYAS
jgi:carbon-monoxide dehydrogenase large subunit